VWHVSRWYRIVYLDMHDRYVGSVRQMGSPWSGWSLCSVGAQKRCTETERRKRRPFPPSEHSLLMIDSCLRHLFLPLFTFTKSQSRTVQRLCLTAHQEMEGFNLH
jgi:hypothetical protein